MHSTAAEIGYEIEIKLQRSCSNAAKILMHDDIIIMHFKCDGLMNIYSPGVRKGISA